MKDHVEIGHLTKYDAFRVNRDQVMAGVLLETGTRVPAPVYSEHSTRLRQNEVSSRQILHQKPD